MLSLSLDFDIEALKQYLFKFNRQKSCFFICLIKEDFCFFVKGFSCEYNTQFLNLQVKINFKKILNKRCLCQAIFLPILNLFASPFSSNLKNVRKNADV